MSGVCINSSNTQLLVSCFYFIFHIPKLLFSFKYHCDLNSLASVYQLSPITEPGKLPRMMGCGPSCTTPKTKFKHLPMNNIPKRYKPLNVLGEGGCGIVIKCEDSKTKQSVAIKLSTTHLTLKNEVEMLKRLNKTTSDDSFVQLLSAPESYKCMVMELLDMNFWDYVIRKAPMRLEDIRTVTEQLAVALDSLRANHIIHTDIKLNNIMLEDRARRPLKVKIIDFGLAVLDDNAACLFRQAYLYRAPETILKIPFSAAVDVWSLGCILGRMISGMCVFPGMANYEQLYYMTKLLGPAPQHILSASKVTSKYFNLTNTDWVLKEKEIVDRSETLSNLDEVKHLRLEPDNRTEAEERELCTELLKSMLKWDEKDRITPREILKHPFITKSFLNASCCQKVRKEEDPRCNPSTSHRVKNSGPS